MRSLPVLFYGTAALCLLSCVGKDNRYQDLVRADVTPELGFITRTSVRLRGAFSLAPVCLVNGVSIAARPVGGWMEISGLLPGTNYSFTCETPEEVGSVSFRTLKSGESLVPVNGFVSTGEIISGANDCYPSARMPYYNRGNGRLFVFGDGRFPCYTEYKGSSWSSTRLSSNYRQLLLTVAEGPSSDAVSFPDGSILGFSDSIDESGVPQNKLAIWSCAGADCYRARSWTGTTMGSNSWLGLSADVSPDGHSVAVASVSGNGSPTPQVALCVAPNAKSSDCASPAAWTRVQLFASVSQKRTETRFDEAGNLWVFLSSSFTPVALCRATSFPCLTSGAWSFGALLNPVSGARDYVQQGRPFFSSAGGKIRVGAAGKSGSNDLLSFAECSGSNCDVLTSHFSNFTAFERTVGAFPSLTSYLTLGENFSAVHYQTTASDLPVRQRVCLDAFALCNDPTYPGWSAASAMPDGLDHETQPLQPGQAEAQVRTFIDASGQPAALLVDTFQEIVLLQYLTP